MFQLWRGYKSQVCVTTQTHRQDKHAEHHSLAIRVTGHNASLQQTQQTVVRKSSIYTGERPGVNLVVSSKHIYTRVLVTGIR